LNQVLQLKWQFPEFSSW